MPLAGMGRWHNRTGGGDSADRPVANLGIHVRPSKILKDSKHTCDVLAVPEYEKLTFSSSSEKAILWQRTLNLACGARSLATKRCGSVAKSLYSTSTCLCGTFLTALPPSLIRMLQVLTRPSRRGTIQDASRQGTES